MFPFETTTMRPISTPTSHSHHRPSKLRKDKQPLNAQIVSQKFEEITSEVKGQFMLDYYEQECLVKMSAMTAFLYTVLHVSSVGRPDEHQSSCCAALTSWPTETLLSVSQPRSALSPLCITVTAAPIHAEIHTYLCISWRPLLILSRIRVYYRISPGWAGSSEIYCALEVLFSSGCRGK